MREPTPMPNVTTQSRLAQTDPWVPSPTDDQLETANNELQAMMQTKIEALERKYQTIIEQKNAHIQQLIQEVSKSFKMERSFLFLPCFSRQRHNRRYLKIS